MLRRSVVINLDTGRGFKGVLWAKRGRLLVLRDAAMLEPGAETVPADGEVVIERSRVEFIQVLPRGMP